MPRTEVDYSRACIYKIVCNDISVTDLYVGSTTSFIQRRYKHKYGCCNENNKQYHLKIYQTINDNGGWDNWTMVEIEKYPCNDKRELEARERYWYDILTPILNIKIPYVTEQETKEFKKKWRQEDKKNNPEKVKELNRIHHENRKDKAHAVYKIWWEKNKDAINEKRRLKQAAARGGGLIQQLMDNPIV